MGNNEDGDSLFLADWSESRGGALSLEGQSAYKRGERRWGGYPEMRELQ
jgi:hypothetical protein